MKTKLSLIIAAAALSVVALAGCSSTPAAPAAKSPSDSSASQAPSTSGKDLATATTSLGSVVVDGKGMTVYYYTPDVKDSGKSSCTGGCLALWPAVVASSSTPMVDGVTGTVGSITRDDGTMQVTINGLPVYTYAQDAAAGDVSGQGVGNVWYVVSPSGEAIKTSAKSGY